MDGMDRFHKLILRRIVEGALRAVVMDGNRGIDHIAVYNLLKARVLPGLIEIGPHGDGSTRFLQVLPFFCIRYPLHGSGAMSLLLACQIVIAAHPVHTQPQRRGIIPVRTEPLGADLYPVGVLAAHEAGQDPDAKPADRRIIRVGFAADLLFFKSV